MANTINYAAIFNRILDEKFYIMPRTSWMENTTPGIQWDGGKEVKIPILETDGLGDMQGCSAPDGDISLEWETKQLQFFRGRNFNIPRYAVNETNFALTADNTLRVFLRQQVVPELDKLRIAYAAQAGVNYGKAEYVASSTLTSANILTALLDDIATVQDRIGEQEQLYIQISTKLKNVLSQSSEITRYMNMKDYSVRTITTQIEAINDEYLIGTPSSYMKHAFQLNDGRSAGQLVGGVAFANLGKNINWIISARSVVDAIARPQVTKVFTPDENQLGDCWRIMFSIYHGIWSYDNKADGILVNLDNSLGALTVSSEAGSASGLTKISVNTLAANGIALMYKLGSAAASVTAGTALAGFALLPANGEIQATSGQTITVALAGTQSLLPIASGTATVVAAA